MMVLEWNMQGKVSSMLVVEKVGFEYARGILALEDVSFTLKKCEKVALFGPNGAGKTTMLHIIAGLKTAKAGRVIYDGAVVSEKMRKSIRARIGLLFQDPDDQLFLPTVMEDVSFGPANLGLEKKDIEERATHALEKMGITHLSHRAPHDLSEGEKKKAAIAGVLALSPDVLLLDEPTSSLDASGKTELSRILASLPQTMLIATHDIEWALGIAERAIVLDKKLVADVAIERLFDSPEVLSKARLSIPELEKLFITLREKGKIEVKKIPRNSDEAYSILEQCIK